MKAQEFLKRAIDPKARIFVVSGAEAFLRDLVIEHIARAFGDHEHLVRDGGDPSSGPPLGELLDELRMADLFGGRHLVHVRRADALVKAHQKALERFVRAGEAVHPLILEGDAVLAKKPPASPPKKGLWAAVKGEGGALVWCLPLYDTPFGGGPPEKSPLSYWLVERARFHGKTLSMKNAYQLHRLAGTSLRTLDGELRKLAMFVGPKKRIDADDIERAISGGRQAPLFELAEQVAHRDLSAALERSQLVFERGIRDASTGRQLRDGSVLAVMIVRTLGTTLRRLFRIREEMDNGASFQTAARAQQVPPFLMDRVRGQLRGFDGRTDGAFLLGKLRELERELKSGGGEPRVLVESFLVEGLSAASVSEGKKSWRK